METQKIINFNTHEQPEAFEKSSKLYEFESNELGAESNPADTKNQPTNKNYSLLDDSLLNFKPHKLCLAKSKSKSDIKKSKNSISKNTNKNKTESTNQNVKRMLSNPERSLQSRTIESAFFKPPDKFPSTDDASNSLKTAHVCPLCFKTFKDSSSHSIHIKSCAVKNKVSTKELFNAIELQERQAAERKSLGLLVAPVLQEKKKLPSRKKLSAEDTDYHLAMAISRSLQEAKDIDQLAEIKAQSLGFTLSEQELYAGRLQNFGFKSDKVPVAPLASSNVRKKSQPTVLQIRSEEDRNSILTEKIAEIIMGTDSVTQKLAVANEFENNLQPLILKNLTLKKMHRTEDKLWDKSKLLSNEEFYVSKLASYIVPTDKQSDTSELSDSNIINVDNKWEGGKDPPSIVLEKPSLENEKNNDTRFIETLIMDWGNTLNTSYASDVIVFVEGNKHIWIHKLVLNVRCSNILLDIVPNDDPRFNSIKEKLCWTQIPYDTALAFLEFIYCADIRKYFKVLDDSNGFSDLRCLARKYKVPELFEYLTLKERERESISKSSKLSPSRNSEFLSLKSKVEDVSRISCISNNSPDLFEDSVQKTMLLENTEINSKNEDCKIDEEENSNDVDLLLSLMRKDPDIDIQNTPKSSKMKDNDDTTSISKIFKRYQSEPIMNTNSEMDTPKKNKNRRKCNVFNLHIDNSDCFFVPDDLNKTEEKQETKRTALSLLEQDMLNEMDSPSDEKFNTTSFVEEKDSDISMYSKYKREHSCNSVKKYRALMERLENDEDISPSSSMISNISTEQNQMDLHSDRSNDSIDIEKSFLTQTKLGNEIPQNLKDHEVDDIISQRTVSPVVLSSPESDVEIYDIPNHLDASLPREYDSQPNISSKISEFDDEFDNIFQKSIFLANVNEKVGLVSESKMPLGDTNNITMRRSKYKKDSPIERWNSTSRIEKNSSVGKLGIKSISEGNIQISPIKTGKKRNYNEISKCPEHDVCIRESKTPPPNYDRMGSPELDEELSKFGLKKQNRSRATKLLTHIYNETHPLLTEAQCLKLKNKISRAFDSNDGPPLKKFNKGHENVDPENESSEESDTSCDSQQSITQAVGAEMEFDEPNSPSNDCKDIKHAFLQLLKADTDLHNKILMYEPLNLESLHASLKTKGFKFKLNDLMDFLDEQCITFQVPESNFRTKRKKNT